MSALIVIIAGNDAERLRTALVLATASAATGASVRIFFQGNAVALLRLPVADPDGARQTAAGLPTLGQLFDEAWGMGVRIGACQSSLALLALRPEAFDTRIEWGGMVGQLAALDSGDRLVVI